MNDVTSQPRNDVFSKIGNFLRDRFRLDEDKDEEQNIVQSITKGIEFRGINLWTLIFAIFIASIGLNVNSTTVIIGAMLISPLNGPIMGIGLGVGINDLELILRALKNLLIAAVISLITSTLYFFLSPLHVTSSGLLSFTSPTVWDACIAFFGGLAGIVASTRRDKTSNVLSGVAIATTLMEPLCTAGYALASGNLYHFAGAFYLFVINTICICIATFLIVRFLRFHQKTYPNRSIERQVRHTIWISLLIVFVPSTYLAYQIVRKTIFEQSAKRFITQECNFQYRQVVSYEARYNRQKSHLQLTLVGEPLPKDSINYLRSQMPLYGLSNATLIVKQGNFKDAQVNVNAITNTVTDQVIKYSQASIARKDRMIDSLQRRLRIAPPSYLPVTDLRNELKILVPDIQVFTAAQSLVLDATHAKPDTIILVYAKFARRHTLAERKKVESWLKIRTKNQKVKLIVE